MNIHYDTGCSKNISQLVRGCKLVDKHDPKVESQRPSHQIKEDYYM
jgi:hypothetical protein